MNLNQLKYFVAVVENGSYQRASKNLFLSPQAISKSIRELEAELCVQLIQKDGRSIGFTPISRQLYEKASSILAELQAIEHIAQIQPPSFNAERIIHVGLASNHIRGSTLDKTCLKRLRKHFGTTRIEVETCPHETCLDLLREGIADVIVHSAPFLDHEFREVHLGDVSLGILAHNANPLTARKAVDITDLGGNPIAIPYDMGKTYGTLVANFRLHELSAKFEYVAPREEDHLDFLARGGLVLAYENTPLLKKNQCRFLPMSNNVKLMTPCIAVMPAPSITDSV